MTKTGDNDDSVDYYRARYYDPSIGRFLSQDPIGFGGGVNFYAYVGNGPTGRRDPSGKDWLKRASDFSAGGGDAITFGGTAWVRRRMGTYVGKCTGWYKAGEFTGSMVRDTLLAEMGGRLLAGGRASELEEICALCFTAGTPIHTRNGLTRIEKIRVGDWVQTRNSTTGKLEYKQVTALTRPHLSKVVELSVQGSRNPLRTTAEHPFWTRHASSTTADWLSVDHMHTGDLVLTTRGTWRKVAAIGAPSKQEETVYNFEVEQNHDFFVGWTGVLVHNAPCSTRSQAFNDAKNANDIPTSQMPDSVIKPGTADGYSAGLDPELNVRQYEFTNSRSEPISIREDYPVDYPDGGHQPPHFNSGPSGGKLENHHYWPD